MTMDSFFSRVNRSPNPRRAAVRLCAMLLKITVIVVGFQVAFGTLCTYTFGGSKQLYRGTKRPLSEVVTIIQSGFIEQSIPLDGKWVKLHHGSQVLPGTYTVSSITTCRAEGKWLPRFGFYAFHDSFTAAPGDTITYFVTGVVGYLVRNGETCYGEGFSHTISHPPNTAGSENIDEVIPFGMDAIAVALKPAMERLGCKVKHATPSRIECTRAGKLPTRKRVTLAARR